MLNLPLIHFVGLFLASLCSIPALNQISKRCLGFEDLNPYNHEGLYEDEDGVASDRTQSTERSTIPQICILIGSIAGLLLSIVAIVDTALCDGHRVPLAPLLSWGIWILITVQSFGTILERAPVKKYELSLCDALTCLSFVVVSILSQITLTSHDCSWDGRNSIFVYREIAQVFAAILSIVASLSLRRRPRLSKGGVPVDCQYSASFLERYSYHWCYSLLRLAKSKGRLDLEDLPTLNHSTFSQSLRGHFQYVLDKYDVALWKMVFVAHWSTFLQQYALSMLQSAAQLAPQFAMYSLLKVLDGRRLEDTAGTVGLPWAIGLGLSMIVSAWMETQSMWMMFSRLVLCIRSELIAVIYMKAMRRKDVKSVSMKGIQPSKLSQHDGSSISSDLSNNDSESTLLASVNGESDNDADLAQQLRLSIINLVSVDTKRVTDFVGSSHLLPSSVFKLIISIAFLNALIGWESVLAGLAILVVFTPFNLYFSNIMNRAQRQIMQVRDEKMAIINEALHGIRQIKFVASEQQWLERIRGKRNEELRWQWYSFLLRTALVGLWALGPVMISAVALSVHTLLQGSLSPSVAFTSIAVLGQIEGSLAIIPKLIMEALEAAISANRIGQYLAECETVSYTEVADTVVFMNASIAWPTDLAEKSPGFSLQAINVSFPPKELSIISGKTGSGKSLLLAAIIGEAEKLSGTISVPKPARQRHDDNANLQKWIIPEAMAFVAQVPWIENASIKDNILFGLPHQGKRYALTLSVCALNKDLEILPDGDLTDIGAGGVNLSGGQKWRVSFARAIYSRAGILILDDIFSAVDTDVGSHLFEKALCGELGEGRTRILVTHHTDLCLSKASCHVILGHGGLIQVENSKSPGSREMLVDIPTIEAGSIGVESLGRRSEDQQHQHLDISQSIPRLEEGFGEPLARKIGTAEEERGPEAAKPKKFVEDEKRDTGAVTFSTYRSYLKAAGGLWVAIVVFVAHLGYMASILGRSWWITIWTRSYANDNNSTHVSVLLNASPQHPIFTKDKRIQSTGFGDRISLSNPGQALWAYVGVYLGLSIFICFLFVVKFYSVLGGSLKASRVLFEDFNNAIFRAPLRWLDTTPTGRLLNRFTTDFNVIDESMADSLGFFLNQVLQLGAILVAGVLVSPLVILFAGILLLICFYLATLYLPGSRDVKRLGSVTRSPIFEQLESAMIGIGTIRAFGMTDVYVQRMFNIIDDHARATFYRYLFNPWMILRLNIVGAIFATLVALVIVCKSEIDGSLAGFALSFALQYTVAVEWAIRQYSSTQLSMNSTERILEYSEMESEDNTGVDVPASWPSEGVIEIENLVVGYTPDQPVLKGVSFKAERNQRIGVVGRTGAGKSTLTLALFRFLNASAGRILIDGIDISAIKLSDLRSRVAIVPQDPTLFCGTIRSNLDPFNEYTDQDLLAALSQVHINKQPTLPAPSTPLTNEINNKPIFGSLSSPISEGGHNLSQGQRQLLCLARAILSHQRIMVMDEATSSVDKATDTLIQRSIREGFQNRTMIVIAHRLSTVADFDKILVLGEGRVIEFDEPKVLMERKGAYWKMVRQSGERGGLEDGAGNGVSV